MATDQALGRIYRRNLAEHLRETHGPLMGMVHGEWLPFRERKYLVPYSRYHPTEKCCFYGVDKADWENWSERCHLLLVMPDAVHVDSVAPEIRYIDLPPIPAERMLGRCSADQKGNLKVLIYTDGGAVDWTRPSLSYMKQPFHVQWLDIDK